MEQVRERGREENKRGEEGCFTGMDIHVSCLVGHRLVFDVQGPRAAVSHNLNLN